MVFYKYNILRNKYVLTEKQIVKKFNEWLSEKNDGWIERHYGLLHLIFVRDGLSSTTDPENHDELQSILESSKRKFLKSKTK